MLTPTRVGLCNLGRTRLEPSDVFARILEQGGGRSRATSCVVAVRQFLDSPERWTHGGLGNGCHPCRAGGCHIARTPTNAMPAPSFLHIAAVHCGSPSVFLLSLSRIALRRRRRGDFAAIHRRDGGGARGVVVQAAALE